MDNRVVTKISNNNAQKRLLSRIALEVARTEIEEANQKLAEETVKINAWFDMISDQAKKQKYE